MVYGTGWDYEPWYGDDYYGWGWTWGYDYWYVPWYGWWVWRPWWNDRGGLRAALIDNIYDRWQGRGEVTPHDRVGRAAANAAQRQAFSGHPALYGRFKGTARPSALAAPANTLALNPYTRPQAPVRGGDTPRGAQLLSSVRQTPGGGRDLYASPDGNVYQRRNDGWYRRQAAGNWSLVAPTPGNLERAQAGGAARGAQGAGNGYRIAANPNGSTPGTQGRRDRAPNVGSEARAQEVASLEREHYARALSQMRSQNTRPSYGGGGRAARGGGRRR
jgi:hypothetical protein